MKYIITPEIHAEIQRAYQGDTGNGEIKDLAARMGLPRWRVSRYAITKGWIAKQKKEPNWSDEELRILERNAHRTPHNIQMKLMKAGFKRSENGIVIKRKKMRFLKNLAGQTCRSVAQCFGIDDHSISAWIERGWLKAWRRGTERTPAQGGDQWYIKDQWIKDFVVEYVAVIDFRKVDKYWLVDLLAGYYPLNKEEERDAGV